MGTKTFTAETKKNGNPAYATVTYKVTNKSTKESAKFKGQFKIKRTIEYGKRSKTQRDADFGAGQGGLYGA